MGDSMRPRHIVVVALAGLLGCGGRDGPAVASDTTRRPPIAPNGLPSDRRDVFYHLPEGGNFIPFSVFKVLERADSEELFRDGLDEFGFLPDPRSETNPHGLPVGMSLEIAPDLGIELVGVNCSACHVGQIEYEGKSYRIEGAPNLLDFVGYTNAFGEAVSQTFSEKEKLFRFLKRYFESETRIGGLFAHVGDHAALEVAGALERDLFEAVADIIIKEEERTGQRHRRGVASADEVQKSAKSREIAVTAEGIYPEHLSLLDAEPQHEGLLAKLEAKSRRGIVAHALRSVTRDISLLQARAHAMRTVGSSAALPMTRPGPGRFDAFGFVRNVSFAQYGPRPMNAPTAISHLWGMADHAWYHFMGNTTTVVGRTIGPLVVILDKNYDTTLLFENINTLERLDRTLRAPQWPEMLPAIDAEMAGRGEAIYFAREEVDRDVRRGNCASCHNRARPFEGDARFSDYPTFTPAQLGVDSTMTDNFNTYLDRGKTLTFAQGIRGVLDKIERRHFGEAGIGDAEYTREYAYGRTVLEWRDSPGIPARPLSGVWATAPYLHNNSVPTLYHLLLRASERPKKFPVGHRDFDPVKIGYRVDITGSKSTFDVDDPPRDGVGRAYKDLPNGNSNAGHEYGVDLSHDQRMDLLEYLKTL